MQLLRPARTVLWPDLKPSGPRPLYLSEMTCRLWIKGNVPAKLRVGQHCQSRNSPIDIGHHCSTCGPRPSAWLGLVMDSRRSSNPASGHGLWPVCYALALRQYSAYYWSADHFSYNILVLLDPTGFELRQVLQLDSRLPANGRGSQVYDFGSLVLGQVLSIPNN